MRTPSLQPLNLWRAAGATLLRCRDFVWGGSILFMVLSPGAFAAEKLVFGKKVEAAFRLPDQKAWVSASCQTEVHQLKPCQARLARDKITLSSYSEQTLAGGVHPGALLCQQFGGNSWLGVDQKGNERSVCRFSDDSWISNSGLFARWLELKGQ
jgi:hypothetical protein